MPLSGSCSVIPTVLPLLQQEQVVRAGGEAVLPLDGAAAVEVAHDIGVVVNLSPDSSIGDC